MLGDDYARSVSDDQYFVDFLRDAEEMGNDSIVDISSEDSDFDMPHIYEAIAGWDSLKDRLIYFMNQYNDQVCVNYLVHRLALIYTRSYYTMYKTYLNDQV